MPCRGNGAWLVKPREPLARFLKSLKRLFVAALLQTDGSNLGLSDGDISFVSSCFVTLYCRSHLSKTALAEER